MFIPKLGTELQVTRDWHIKLVCESRNKSLWDMCCYPPMDAIQYHHAASQSVNIRAGARLKVARIFIRKGITTFDSVTLFGPILYLGVMRKVRFWVSLKYFNILEAEVIE